MDEFFEDVFESYSTASDVDVIGLSIRQVVLNQLNDRISTFIKMPERDELLQLDKTFDLFTYFGIRVGSLTSQIILVDRFRHSDLGVSLFSFLTGWANHLLDYNVRQCTLLGDKVSRQATADCAYNDIQVYIRQFASISGSVANWTPNSILTSTTTFPFPDARDGYTRLYHGTNLQNATSIVTDGFDLTKAATTCDFGAGFYLTANPCAALLYAMLRIYSNGDGHDPAVIAFDIRTPDLAPWSIQNDTWERVVTACRRQRLLQLRSNSPEIYGAFIGSTIIYGSITSNATRIECGARPIPSAEFQYCFRRPEVIEASLTCIGVLRIHRP